MRKKTDLKMAEKSKLHERMCVSCGRMREREVLLRIMRTEDGFRMDPGQKAGGRGAYVCAEGDCFRKMCAKRMLNRSFRTGYREEEYRKLQEEYQRIYG